MYTCMDFVVSYWCGTATPCMFCAPDLLDPPPQVQLSPDQCGSPKWTPCYNVYAVNETHGDLVWFAFTTSSAAVKGMHLVSAMCSSARASIRACRVGNPCWGGVRKEISQEP